ncbi:CU044_5270 family protein [Pseudonocardia sp. DLS-67]
MDELQILGTVLTPDEPSRESVDRSRSRLLDRIDGRPAQRRGQVGRWVSGLALTAGVAAAAVVASVVAAPAPAVPAAATMSAPQVLLAAAAAAESTPESSGSYWHVTVRTNRASGSPSYTERWITPDGRQWFKAKGELVQHARLNQEPFSLAGDAVTVEQLRNLPTDPEALKTWIARAAEHTTAVTSAGPLTPEQKARTAFESLISLVSGLPAPPAVRAAAFRAIATYPHVTSLGAVPGGQGLQIDSERLVVDPATGTVNETTMLVTIDGVVRSFRDGNTATIQAEWTETSPE